MPETKRLEHDSYSGGKAKDFEKMIVKEVERVKPIIKEQFLREYILGVGDTDETFKIYCNTFNVDYLMKTRMILLKPFERAELEDLLFFETIIERVMGDLVLSTTIKDNILIITNILDREEILCKLDDIMRRIKRYYGFGMMAIYSDVINISDTPYGFERLSECLGYSFYADGNEILFEGDININSTSLENELQYGGVERAVKSGDFAKTEMLLSEFFNDIEKNTPAPAVAKTYCLELYVCIIRCCSVEKIDKYMKGIVAVQDFETLREMKAFIHSKAAEIVTSNAPKSVRIYSSLIKDTIAIIDDNLGNENLSLRWLAGTILYTNVDYLGKLFKKEIGKNFSHYVMEKRMELAKKLILSGEKDKIYEIAEQVGYGSNSQYFSQVFKKYTGISPLEYKEFTRVSNSENEEKKDA